MGDELPCECWEFPLANGTTSAKDNLMITPGTRKGDYNALIQSVIAEAKRKADNAAASKLKKKTCKTPCVRSLYVDSEVISPVTITNSRGVYSVEVRVFWQAGILCYKEAPAETPKSKTMRSVLQRVRPRRVRRRISGG